ncbi:MAG: 30S ribosomal protein S8 [Candidatus Omnitrophica bacterium]|nr:30S ribosomal protein S8 [Candidatus Omnitrophota bacterium]
MSRTDLIADTLTILRNAVMAKKKIVDLPYSKMNVSIFKILKEKQFIEDFKLMEYSTEKSTNYKHRVLRVYLKYVLDKPAITSLKRISKPGLRIYVNRENIPQVLRGYGIAILSTSKGIMTDEEARKHQIGGEVICYVW